jgi:hypothetical protein
MTTDLKQQVRGYVQHADSQVALVAVDELGLDIETLRQPTPVLRVRRGLTVALAAAAVVLVVVGGVQVALRSDRTSGPVATETPSTAAPAAVEPAPGPEPTEAPSPTQAPEDPAEIQIEPVQWTGVFDLDLTVPGTISALIETPHGYIAGGTAEDPGQSSTTAAIWISPDGIDWTRVESDAFGGVWSPFGGDSSSAIHGLAVHTGRVVALGVDAPGDVNSTERVAAVWWSDDGLAWQRLAHDSEVFGAGADQMNAVAVPFYSGFVAVGSGMWTSPNGLEWERKDFDEATVYTVIETFDGVLAGGEAEGRAAIWFSADLGGTWETVELPTSPESGGVSAITGIAQTTGGYLAVGSQGAETDLRPVAWASPDGTVWDRVWIGDRGTALAGAAASDERIIAVGSEQISGNAGSVWYSVDEGGFWVRETDSRFGDSSSAGSSAFVRAVLVPAGRQGAAMVAGSRDGSPAVWVGTWDVPPPPTTLPPPPTQWSCQARIDNGAAWVLADWVEEVGAYVVDSPLACIDFREEHYDARRWKVEWEGEIDTVEVGFLLVFEKELHGPIYAENEVDTKSGVWVTPEIDPDDDAPFVFVAMPHSFDDWQSIAFTVTPCTDAGCS